MFHHGSIIRSSIVAAVTCTMAFTSVAHAAPTNNNAQIVIPPDG